MNLFVNFNIYCSVIMIPLLLNLSWELPFSNPVVKFLLILLVILIVPLILERMKIPSLLGLIIAGAIIGPNGFHLLERDSGIILSGTAGLLYIMFLAGLEIDLIDFNKNKYRSIIFGIFTFVIPMILGSIVSYYFLNFSILTSLLLASMFASHTLLAYPMISKLGVSKNQAVNVTIGGTIITDTLALIVLAIVIGVASGEVTNSFWIELSISLLIFSSIILFVFPIIAHIFMKYIGDSISQYIFVLTMVFLGSVLAEIAGVEGIIGAFLTGLSLNKLIPHTSTLMNRIEFVGNSIFIPFFLISVGMLINYKILFTSLDSLIVAITMIFVATSAKFLAAYATQKTFNYTKDERNLIFGLSNAQAAATLAAVLVGYNFILEYDVDGNPIRLLDDSVLNGTILMILATCTIASFVAQKGAINLVLKEEESGNSENIEAISRDNKKGEVFNKMMLCINNVELVDEYINFALSLRSKKVGKEMYAVSILSNRNTNDYIEKNALKGLYKAQKYAAAAGFEFHINLRYYDDIKVGLVGVKRELKIGDIIIVDKHISKLGKSIFDIFTFEELSALQANLYYYNKKQPISTIKVFNIILPQHIEKTKNFSSMIVNLWMLGKNTGAKINFFAHFEILEILKLINFKYKLNATFSEICFDGNIQENVLQIKQNEAYIFIITSKDSYAFKTYFEKLNQHYYSDFSNTNLITVFLSDSKNSAKNINSLAKLNNESLKIEDIANSILFTLKSLS